MDLSYRRLAARYIRRQAAQLADQLAGVRAGEDIEFVHRARVATRRLRTALQMFADCFGTKRLGRWRKAIRQTTAKLGDARDRDVQIELLCGTLRDLTAPESLPGIARVLAQFEREREGLQRQVIQAVDRLERKGVLGNMRRATKKILRKADPTENVQTSVAFAGTRRRILGQLDDLLRHQNSLANPDDQEGHHDMRIAVKHLRYSLEIARPVYPGRLEESIEGIKRVQTLLGDVHDCDVWVAHLDAFAAAERHRLVALFGHAGRLGRLQPGIDYLRHDRQRHRQEAFGQLVEYWADLERRQFWGSLAGAVLAGGDHPSGETPVERGPTLVVGM